jgi:phospholipid transport system substrate-binding protein
MPIDVVYLREPHNSAARLERRILLRLAIICAVLGLPRSAGASVVSASVEQLHAALLQIMKAGKLTPFQQRYNVLAPVIDRTFDLDDILKISIGPPWVGLPPEQQAALKEAFRRYTIATYVSNFDNFTGQRFEIQPALMAAGEDQVVQTRIVPNSGEAHRLDYVMRQIGGTWKVLDVLADGSISRVAVQRSEMRAVLANGGGPALLDRLQKKAAEMSGGQLR